MGFIAKVVGETSARMKFFFGPFAYFLTVYRLIQNPSLTKLDIDLDNGRYILKNVEGNIVQCSNTLHLTDGNIYCPLGMINDGLLELKVMEDPFKSISDFERWYQQCYDGGLGIYHEKMYRLKTATLRNRNYDSEGYLLPQHLSMDGKVM